MPANNLFLEPGVELAAAVERSSQNLLKLSGVLPVSAQADDASHYARGAGRGLDETQRALLERTGFVCVLARAMGWAGVPLTPSLIQDMHDGIFAPVFGERTLAFRKRPARGDHRRDDGVEYPIWVPQTSRPPKLVTKKGSEASQVVRRVGEACESFEAVAVAVQGDHEAGALALARLYVRLIRIHPFVDGNGRTAWAALQLAAGRLRFPFVQSTPTAEARLALGNAIRDGNAIGPLANHIKRAAWGEEDLPPSA